MNTKQNYVGGGDNATQQTPAAQNEGQTSNSVDNRQPQSSAESFSTATIQLPLCIWEGNESGCLSEVNLVYWALERSKSSYLKQFTANPEGSEDYAEADYCLNKILEIQNTLFDGVSVLASQLSKAVNGMSCNE